MESKLWLIVKREFTTRARNKAFLIMSVLGPLIMSSIILFSFWLNLEEGDRQQVLVIDDNFPFFQQLPSTELVSFDVQDLSMEKAESLLAVSEHTALLYLPKNILQSKSAQLIFKKEPSFRVQRLIEVQLQQYLELSKLKEFELSESEYKRLKAPVVISAIKYESDKGEISGEDVFPSVVGQLFGILVFLFIFTYSVAVMRGVIEEKSNRIVEVIISSINPHQLMYGKILGIGAVGLLQFVLWIALTATIVGVGQEVIIGDRYMAGSETNVALSTEMQKDHDADNELNLVYLGQDDNLFNELQRVNIALMLTIFLIYFIGGFLLYSALMAAVGAAIDNETDTQQFVLPITFPLFLSYLMSFYVLNAPNSTLAVWLSIIPFTSPVIMLVRISHGLAAGDIWQLYLSVVLLILTFLMAVWISARIYRVGILMYGKKATFKEILKWVTYN